MADLVFAVSGHIDALDDAGDQRYDLCWLSILNKLTEGYQCFFNLLKVSDMSLLILQLHLQLRERFPLCEDLLSHLIDVSLEIWPCGV